jgi:hypothetical protein
MYHKKSMTEEWNHGIHRSARYTKRLFACVGVVVARNLQIQGEYPDISRRLPDSIAGACFLPATLRVCGLQ